jgi:polyisoprenoid-binding protein YceI
MKKIALLFFAAVISIAVYAQTTWKVDPMHSKLGFIITHMGIADVAGYFRTFEVTVSSSQADFSDAVIQMTTDVKSVDTFVEPRDNHLRSADFFDVEKYPQMTFTSTSVERIEGNKYKLTGDLTMHGVTRQVVMDMVYRGTVTNDKGSTAGLQITGALKRSDFGIGEKFQAPALSDEVRIIADGEFKLEAAK